MSTFPNILEELVEKFNRFPGIGRKTAERLTFFLVSEKGDFCESLASSLRALKEGLKICENCGHFSEMALCKICQDPSRDSSQLCIVGEIKDLLAVEKTDQFHGKYHVLGGIISPLRGITPQALRIGGLLERLEKEPIKEVILALTPTLEGETTSLYVQKLLKGKNIQISQIIYGVPLGGELEFTDRVTLAHSLKDRKILNSAVLGF